VALEHLLASLEREAVAQAESLVADARARAATATAAAEARVAGRRRELLDERERRQRATAETALVAARRAARGRALEARARLLERVFAVASARLPSVIGEDAFRAVLPARLAAARACLGGAPAVLRCAPSLATELRRRAKGDGVAVEPDAAVATGFLVATRDGAVEVDETLQHALERRRPRLALDVVRALDGDGTAA
jgi:vacuolar-type H+-ATPase subunit E/Vma4